MQVVKIAFYLVSISQLLCVVFFNGWRFLNKISFKQCADDKVKNNFPFRKKLEIIENAMPNFFSLRGNVTQNQLVLHRTGLQNFLPKIAASFILAPCVSRSIRQEWHTTQCDSHWQETRHDWALTFELYCTCQRFKIRQFEESVWCHLGRT